MPTLRSSFLSSDPDWPILRVPTADGGHVAIKHRPQRGGQPVILLHGLAVNADIWDLPEVRGADFHYRSLAALLHDAGHDVYLVNWRGHGAPHMLSTSPPGQCDWCVDHFLLYDLPAAVGHIGQTTGQRPVVIGASMGALTLAAYLEGAHGVASDGMLRIELDRARAQRRQERLAGCVLAEFPAALRWPNSAYDALGHFAWSRFVHAWRGPQPAANFGFEFSARAGWLQALTMASGAVPLRWLRGRAPRRGTARAGPTPATAPPVGEFERRLMQALLSLAGTFTGATHHRAEVMLAGRRYVVEDMKAGVLRQLADGVRRRAFVSALGTPDVVYSDHYHLIELPVLVVQGARDRIANVDMTRTAFYDVITSPDKTWLIDPDIAHGEIEAAPVACERVYPVIMEWIRALRSS